MASPYTTEIVLVSCASPVTLSDPDNAVNKVLSQIGPLIKKQPGVHGVFFGGVEEDDHKLVVFVNWSSLSDHETFTASTSYPEFKTAITSVLAGPPQVVHYLFPSRSSLEAILRSARVEMLRFFLPSASDSFARGLHDFVASLGKPEGHVEGAAAWGEESVQIPSGGEGRVFTELNGWDSAEAEEKFNALPAFGAGLGPLMAEVKGFEKTHFKLREVK